MVEFEQNCVPAMGQSVELPELKDGWVVKVNWVERGPKPYVEVYVR